MNRTFLIPVLSCLTVACGTASPSGTNPQKPSPSLSMSGTDDAVNDAWGAPPETVQARTDADTENDASKKRPTTAEVSVSSCPALPKGGAIFRTEPSGGNDDAWKKIVPLKPNTADGQPVRFVRAKLFWHDINNNRKSAALLLFGTRTEQGIVPDCNPSGLCRQAVVLQCDRTTWREALPEGRYGFLTANRAAYSNGELGMAPLQEIRWTNGVGTNRQQRRIWRYGSAGYEASTVEEGTASLKPHVSYTADFEVYAENLPAVSADGKRVAVVREFAWYDESGYKTLLVYRTRDNRLMQQVALEEYIGEKRRLSNAETASAVKTANALLKRGGFIPMIPLRSPYDDGPAEGGAGAGFTATVDSDRAMLTVRGAGSAEIQLPGFPSHGACCSPDYETPVDCLLPALVTGIWADGIRGALVVKTENFNGPDGCETEPKFIIKNFR